MRLHIPALVAGFLLLTATAASLAGPAAGAAAPGRTFSCSAFGYSFSLPPRWRPAGGDCAKPAARILTAPDGVAVIGAQIANYDGASSGFEPTVTRDLAQLGLPASGIRFGSQILNRYTFQMALYEPPANRIGKRLWAYAVGTQVHGVEYLFQGYIFTDQPSLVPPLRSQIHDIFDTIHFSTGTSPAFARAARAPRVAGRPIASEPSAIDYETLALPIMAVLLVGAGAAILLVAARRQPAERTRRRR